MLVGSIQFFIIAFTTQFFNIKSLQVTKRLPHWGRAEGISIKFVVGFEGLWAHTPSKHTIDFMGMPSPMGEFLCLLVRLDVKSGSGTVQLNSRYVRLYSDSEPVLKN